jgi:hypothetical protein
MKVLETERGVSVAEDRDKDGRTIYRVLRCQESLMPLYSLADARHLASVIRPRKVTCSKCGQSDIETFLAEVGVGQFRAVGSNGWIMERFFGGQRDFEDIVLCPDCVEKERLNDRVCGS